MHAKSPRRPSLILAALAALATSLGSCALYDQGGHNHIGRSINDVHIVRADGTGDRVMATGGDYYPILLGDSTILVLDIYTGLWRGTYGGAALTQFSPGPWVDCSMSRGRELVVLTGYDVLYTMNADGSNLSMRSVAAGIYRNGRIAPDLDEMLFRRPGAVCTMGMDGSNIRMIDTLASNLYPEYPLYVDENRILYSIDSGSVVQTPSVNGSTSIVLYDKRDRTRKLLVAHHQLCYFNQNDVRGDTLLCIEGAKMKLLNLRTGEITTLDPSMSVSYSPDRSAIVFTDDVMRQIFIRDVQSGVTRVAYTESDPSRSIYSAEISPDNKFIVFIVSYGVPD